MKHVSFFISCLLCSTCTLFAQSWNFDNSFGSEGKTTFNLANSADFLFDIAHAPDGSVYGIGEIDKGNLNGREFILVKFNTQGKIDPDFASGGYRELSDLSECNDIAIQQDGKILVAGRESPSAGYTLRQYTPEGARDFTFGYLGKATHPSIRGSRLQSIVVLDDGKILGIGSDDSSPFSSDFMLVKFNPDGRSLDNSFGSEGVARHYLAQGQGNDLVVQDDGSIVAVGYNKNVKISAARFTADGTLDPSFGNNGVMEYAFGGEGRKAMIQEDGKLLFGGSRSLFDSTEIILFRVLEDGRQDDDFTPISFVSPLQNRTERSYYDQDYGLILMDNGNILQSFYDEINGESDILLMMHQSDGTVANAFGNGGQLRIDLSTVYERGSNLIIDDQGRPILCGISDLDLVLLRLDSLGNLDDQYGGKFNLGTGDEQAVGLASYPDGKILVRATNTAADIYDRDLLISRLNPSGDPDNDFAGSGILLSGLNSELRRANAAVVTPDGKTLLAGHNYDNSLVEVSRLDADGMPDLSFGNNGYVRFPFIDTSFTRNTVTSMLLQDDGKILVGGVWDVSLLPEHFAIARLLPDGTLDPEFGMNGVVRTSFPDEEGTLTCLARDAQGNIYAGGYHELAGPYEEFAIIKYSADGSLDTDFGEGGIATYLTEMSCDILELIIHDDANIIAIGNVYNASSEVSAGILRINSQTGAPDGSFGTDGWVYSTFGMDQGGATSGLQMEREKVLVAGAATDGTDVYFSIGRWLFNGDLDVTFGDAGYIRFQIGASPSGCQDILLQPDKSILLAGLTVNDIDGGSDIAMARIINKLDVGTIDREDPSDVLLVYPNPVRDQFELQFELNTSGECNVALYDMNGQLVQWLSKGRSFSSGTNIVSLHPDPALPPGAYYLRIHCGSKYQAGAMIYKQ